MGGGGGGDVTIGYRYYMSIQMLLARGPIDELVEIKVGDKKVWPLEGQTTATESWYYRINAPEIFGGDDREGGIDGTFILMMGEDWQDAWDFVKTTMGGRVPGFRGVVTMFYDGLICSMNPYPKQWKMRMRRTISGWDGAVWRPDLAIIWHLTEDGTNIKSMNPAHIIYECATNRKWGRGLPRAFINEASFAAAAQTLRDEGFGMCLRWNRQDSLQNFVQDVINHIGGSLYIDRATGLLSLKLIRGDYDPNTLPLYDYNSGLLSVEEADTAARDDAVNEVVVKWRYPITGEDRQVRVHNLASIQTLGCVNSQTTEYKGLPTLELATRVAQRDLRVTTAALKRYTLKLDRRAWRVQPGDVIRFSAPDRNIQNLVLRVGKAEDGPLTEGTITVEGVIDVFGLASTAIVVEEPSQWTPPDFGRVPITQRYIREMTYRELAIVTDKANLNLVTPDQAYLFSLAVKPTPLSLGYTLYSKPDGEEYTTRSGTGFVPKVSIIPAIGPTDTVVPFNAGIDLGIVTVGLTAQIGEEIVRVDDIDVDPADPTAGTLTIARGCVDTIPAGHAAGSVLMFADNQYPADWRQYVAGETLRVKLVTRTSSGTLPLADAAEDVIVMRGRQGMPYPPGKVRVNDGSFAGTPNVVGDVILTWKHRNRLIQQDRIIDHEADNVTPEVGTTYTINVFRASAPSTLLRSYTGITDNTWAYTSAMNLADAAGANLIFELFAIRDGIPSFQYYRFDLTQVIHTGYGAAYGASYGN